MSKYDEMSDFEMAKRVATALKLCIQDPVVKNQDYISVLDPDCDMYVVKFDPCNNPNDAWPIIVENGINLVQDGDGGYYATDGYLHHSGSIVDGELEFNDKNPLRAAMIVFLMMKEGEQCS